MNFPLVTRRAQEHGELVDYVRALRQLFFSLRSANELTGFL